MYTSIDEGFIWTKVILINMLRYLMQFGGPSRTISKGQHHFAQANGIQLTQQGFMHYYYPLNITKYRP